MKVTVVAALAALVLTAAGPAWAQSAADWEAFADETLAQYGSPSDLPDWEDLLYAAHEAHPADAAAALEAFAVSTGLARDEAGRQARSIMQLVSLRRDCRYDDCVPGDPAVILPALLAEAAAEPSGALLTVIAKHAFNPDTLRAMRAHPQRLRLLSEIYAYNEEPVLLALMVLEAPDAREVLDALRTTPPEVGGDADHWDGWLLAIVQYGFERLVDEGAPINDQAVYAQILLSHHLRLGLTDEAVALWRRQSPALRAALPLAPPDGCGVPPPATTGSARLLDDRCEPREAGTAFVDDMAAALWQAGDPTAALALMTQGEERLGGAQLMGQTHAAVSDAMRRERPADSLFDLYVYGDTTLPWRRRHALNGGGWLYADYGPAGRRLATARARDAGYGSVAESMEATPPYYRSAYQPPTLDPIADTFPASVRSRRADLAPRIETAWSAFPEPRRGPRGGAARVPAVWTETALPDGLTPWREPDRLSGRGRPRPLADLDEEVDADDTNLTGDEAARAAFDAAETASLAADAAAVDAGDAAAAAAVDAVEAALAGMLPEEGQDPTLPVVGYAVLRLDDLADGERALIFRDPVYDLPGETGAYGLWFTQTVGGRWGEPVYLGLQEHFPYVVAPRSELPLIDGGRLQIEVQVREVDPSSITFPPVGLRLIREEDGVVISASLADLTRDSDADGLPDLVEARLDLDAANPDMDGDGLVDGVDPVPQVAFNPSASPARTALALTILKQMVGYDAAAIVVPVATEGDDPLALAVGGPSVPSSLATIIIGGDPDLFAGLDLPFRLLAYTPEALDALSDRGAPFYPPTVVIHSSLDGARHLVIWSASWVGGSFVATCAPDADVCDVEELSSWIT